MIADAEVRREARRTRIQPGVVDLDYVLGWALRGLAGQPYLRSRLLFKGGTCLRKCYFPDYRFSEDLDFTATEWFDWKRFEEAIRLAFREAEAASGIDFVAQEPRVEVLNDEYGREGLQVRIYYWGPHRAGSPRAIRIDVSRDEVVVFGPEPRRVHHHYSDAPEIGDLAWPCYTLEEVLAEKLRAILGQRRHAVSRDLYDIHTLLGRGVDLARVRNALPTKLEAKELTIEEATPGRVLAREAEFLADWNRTLLPLLQPDRVPEFAEVWSAVVRCVAWMLEPWSAE